MARERTVTTHGVKHNALVAAATKIQLDKPHVAKRQASQKMGWQNECWEAFDVVPEVKYATWFLGNAMAKLRIYPAVRQLDNPEGAPVHVTDPASGISPDIARRATDELSRLRGPLGGQGEILRMLNMQLEIPGEGYIVGFGPRIKTDALTNEITVTPEAWVVRSIDEVKVEGDGYKTTNDAGDSVLLDADLDDIFRVWQRHPRKWNEPDSLLRGCLGDVEALILLDNQVKAESKARQSAGILLVPNELSFGPADVPVMPDAGEDDESDPFIEELMAALTEPIGDPAAASSVMPFVVRGPSEHLKEFRHLALVRETQSVLEERINGRVMRLARGMNLPVEVVLGHQSTTFANAGQVDEDTFEDHLESRCGLICDALTVGFLQPLLLDSGMDPQVVDRIIVWYDPSDIIGKVDPKASADKGLESDAISWEAWRRVNGWNEDDAPEVDELLFRLLLHIRTFDPTIITGILDAYGANLDYGTDPAAAGGQSAAAAIMALLARAQGTPPPLAASARDRRASSAGRELMAIDRDLRTRLLVAAEHALTRGLERAGNRLKTKARHLAPHLRNVHPAYAAAHVGQSLVADAGLTDSDLLGDDLWTALHDQFFAWGGQAQRKAMDVAARVSSGLTSAERDRLGLRQAADLDEAWTWMHERLATVAKEALFSPAAIAGAKGEFDAAARVPTGLVREAVAIAGGAKSGGLQHVGNGIFVAMSNGQPVGGIGTGTLVTEAIQGNGGGIDGYEWDYGPATRKTPFDGHEELDGTTFVNFDDDVLAVQGGDDWLGVPFYFPGDHDGCACDIVPVIIEG